MGVIMVVLVFGGTVIVVAMSRGGKQADAFRAVNHRHVYCGKSVRHKSFQPCAVDYDYICMFQCAHVLYGQRVVVQTADLLIDHQSEYHMVHTASQCCKQLVDGVCGGGNGQNAVVFCRGSRLTCSAAAQQERK